jgi:diguanylate cyclase (GGDEF)-like protein
MLEAERLLEVIALQNEIVAAGLALESVMSLVTERARPFTGAPGAVIELVDGDDLMYAAASGSAAPSKGLRLARATSLSGRCVAERAPLLCTDADLDPRVDREACRRVGVRSMVCVPLFYGSDAVGVLKVLSPEANAFDERAIEALRLLAGVVAAAMSHAQAFEREFLASRHDALTTLKNRRAYDERLLSEVTRSRRHGYSLSLALLDLDGFKSINDRQGHPAGDAVLRRVATALRGAMRTTDEAFRIGGDELAVLLPATDALSALVALGRLTDRLGKDPELDAGVGLSGGVASLRGETAEQLHARADAALYESKRRDRAAERFQIRFAAGG